MISAPPNLQCSEALDLVVERSAGAKRWTRAKARLRSRAAAAAAMIQSKLFAFVPPLMPLSLPRTPYSGDDGLFHTIDTGTRGLREVSAEPYIFTIDGFLSEAECDALISKMADQSVVEEQPSSEKLQRRGERTSRSVVPQNSEVAGLRDRLAALVGVQLSQMQPLKITRYDAGGVFMRHTDCTEALRAAAGMLPNRFCTVLLYLNDVPRGGRTCWRWRDTDPSFYARQRARRQGAPPLLVRGVALTPTLTPNP